MLIKKVGGQEANLFFFLALLQQNPWCPPNFKEAFPASTVSGIHGGLEGNPSGYSEQTQSNEQCRTRDPCQAAEGPPSRFFSGQPRKASGARVAPRASGRRKDSNPGLEDRGGGGGGAH